jgi:hypothetical protein
MVCCSELAAVAWSQLRHPGTSNPGFVWCLTDRQSAVAPPWEFAKVAEIAPSLKLPPGWLTASTRRRSGIVAWTCVNCANPASPNIERSCWFCWSCCARISSGVGGAGILPDCAASKASCSNWFLLARQDVYDFLLGPIWFGSCQKSLHL